MKFTGAFVVILKIFSPDEEVFADETGIPVLYRFLVTLTSFAMHWLSCDLMHVYG